MDHNFALALRSAQLAKGKEALLALNDTTERYGLRLTNEQAVSLIESRARALRDTGRIALGESALPKLIYAFCDSPYMLRESYVETLAALQDTFYALKSDCEDALSDEELIEGMRLMFDGVAQGSVEYLCGVSPAELLSLTRGERYGAYDE